MKIQFLGTGAAEGVPAMFCNCRYCKAIRGGAGEFRTRSQVIIDDVLSVDFPPEAFYHSLKYGLDLSALKYLLVTHSHMDHFYAHDFILRGYKYATLKTDLLKIFGNEEVFKVYHECTARELKGEVADHLRLQVIHAFKELEVGPYRVLTIPAVHGTKEEALLYYIENEGKGYLHLCDTGTVTDRAISYLAQNGAKADLITFDCTFLDREQDSPRHMTITENMVVKEKLIKAGVATAETRVIITHFSHNCNPTAARIAQTEKKYAVSAAYDGMTVEI